MWLAFRAFLLLLAALPIGAIAMLALCLQDQPLVTGVAQLTPKDIERAKRVIESQAPRREEGSRLQTVTLDEADLALALNYAANQAARASARVRLLPGVALLQASMEAPPNPFGRYINIDAELQQADAAPRLHRLRIGRLPVPSFVADYLLREGLRRLAATVRGQVAARILKSASLGEGRLTVRYQWSDELAGMARSVLAAPEDQQRLRAYQARLAEAVAGAPRALSLDVLMPPLFELALERGAGGDQVRENGAAIAVLAFYTVGVPLDRIAPAAAAWRTPAPRTATLAGRSDLAKHFLVSALIAAEAGSPLAHAIGVYKEIEDSRRGSGFSFSDIGADRAGTRFGEIASLSPQRARNLTKSLASGASEADFMPVVSDLPEFLSEGEFKRRYGEVGSPAYEKVIALIDRRISALPLLHP